MNGGDQYQELEGTYNPRKSIYGSIRSVGPRINHAIPFALPLVLDLYSTLQFKPLKDDIYRCENSVDLYLPVDGPDLGRKIISADSDTDTAMFITALYSRYIVEHDMQASHRSDTAGRCIQLDSESLLWLCSSESSGKRKAPLLVIQEVSSLIPTPHSRPRA